MVATHVAPTEEGFARSYRVVAELAAVEAPCQRHGSNIDRKHIVFTDFGDRPSAKQ
ncbi:hypothetical protein GLA29479_3801 [Lysobacter antibioticus]|nr:hypothetical protein GLA29479_3801 [Lysobacter antibioticus]